MRSKKYRLLRKPTFSKKNKNKNIYKSKRGGSKKTTAKAIAKAEKKRLKTRASADKILKKWVTKQDLLRSRTHHYYTEKMLNQKTRAGSPEWRSNPAVYLKKNKDRLPTKINTLYKQSSFAMPILNETYL